MYTKTKIKDSFASFLFALESTESFEFSLNFCTFGLIQTGIAFVNHYA